ncbi:uncharacterized protein LOC115976442 isoform X3 [Quercus lobata]|uniref:uncharacterized protein LOC115976442 isoform X3 n=1 Tax=Quercus lobata TaxID=97700 RepID=UPI001248F12D|nr:uncharacterized protein LOC115976442 isoform X3 [Quercus lobata]
MASVPLSSLCFSQTPNPLCFSFVASDNLRFSSSSLRFLTPKKNRTRIRVSVCRAASPSPSLVFRNLDADDFRHPLDKQNTLILRAIPGLNQLGKALLGTVAEQVMLLENIGTSVLVSKDQLSDLHRLMMEAAEVLNIEAPDLYVRQSPVPNAYTLAVSGKRPFVVVHTSLVELLTQKELQAVLAHELGHLKCDHGVWLTYANILTLGAYSVPDHKWIYKICLYDREENAAATLCVCVCLGALIAQSLEEQLFRWLRAAELTCDRAALLVAQDPKRWSSLCL